MYKSYNAPSIILNEYSELAQNEAIKLEGVEKLPSLNFTPLDSPKFFFFKIKFL